MKVYNLCCAGDHRFEGWFPSAEDLDDQAEMGLIECPVCGTVEVQRAPSAPHVHRGAGAPAASPATAARTPAALPSGEQMRALFLNMARELALNSEDVGEQFAEEARRIHYLEAPERAIRGVASPDEARELLEEGIPVLPIPGLRPPKNEIH